MADSNEVYMANFFFRDYVTEDIMSYGIGEIWTYHYKETIIGVRDCRNKRAYFLKHELLPKGDNRFSPTIEQVTAAHIKECAEDMEHSEEVIEYVSIEDLISEAKRRVFNEIGTVADDLIG
jgi:hypothetical protein